MNFNARSSLWCLVLVALPLVAACSSSDTSGLFSSGGTLNASGSSHSIGGTRADAGSSSSSGGSFGTTGGASGGTAMGGHPGGGTGPAGGAAAAGSPAGGDPGVAGSGATSAGGGGTAQGGGAGTDQGGMSAGGASAGSGGTAAGGSGGGVSDPCAGAVQGAVCSTPTPAGCFEGGRACACASDSNSGGSPFKGHWSCVGQGTCPDDKPSGGSPCKEFKGAQCAYPKNDVCACAGDFNPIWYCTPESYVCPDKPEGNCSTLAVCQGQTGECTCSGLPGAKWSCPKVP